MNDPILTVIALMVLYGLIMLEDYLSYFHDKRFTLTQMQAIGGGMPFVWHNAIWSDKLLITPLVTAMFVFCHHEWSLANWGLMLVISTAVNAILHFLWSKQPARDCIAGAGEITKAGWVHVVYQGIGLTIIGLFYFNTPHISRSFLIFATVLLMIHLPIGTFLIMNHMNISWRKVTTGDKISSWITCVLGWAGLTWRLITLLGK
jgi:hypothetical protein